MRQKNDQAGQPIMGFMGMKKRFSVITAVYNREDLIKGAIDSVLAQTFTDYEYIVVDDGSTDRTQEILKSYGEQIKVIRQVNQGSELAYITGVSHSSGEYMVFLDSDDIFAPYALATYDKIISELNSPPMIIGSEKRLCESPDISSDFSGSDDIKVLKYCDYLAKDIRIVMSQSKIVMQKTLFEKVYETQWPSCPCYLNDYHLILQAGIFGPCVILDHPKTVIYRQHEGMGSRNIAKMGLGILQLIEAVQSGKCSGGYLRLFDKYAYLGGPVSEWSRKAYKARLFKLSLKIFYKGWAMLLINQINKFLFLFHSSATPVTLHSK